MGQEAEVSGLPEVHNLVKHPLQCGLIAGRGGDVLDALLELDDLSTEHKGKINKGSAHSTPSITQHYSSTTRQTHSHARLMPLQRFYLKTVNLKFGIQRSKDENSE